MLSRIPTPDHRLTRHGWHRHPLRPNQHPMLFRRPWQWSICLKSGAQGSLLKFARRPDLCLWGLRIHLRPVSNCIMGIKGMKRRITI